MNSEVTQIMKNYMALFIISTIVLSIFCTFDNYQFPYHGYNIQTFGSSKTYSKNNKILEFSAYGNNHLGDSFNVSDQGGYVEVEGRKMKVMPWSYANFTEENMFVFYLANITSNTFDIFYLYLDYENGIKGIRHFNYQLGTDVWIRGFIGKASISNKEAYTPSIEMPDLNIKPKALISNKVFIQGKDLYFVDRIGYLNNDTNNLIIYPLMNIFDSKHGWNQIWTLLKDKEASYFSIFHLNSIEANSVVQGQTLRLNDYESVEHKSFNATWSINEKSYNMTVKAPFEEFNIIVDGFKFKFTEQEMIIPVSGGNHEIHAPEEIRIEESERYVFDSWNDGVSKNPRFMKINQDISISVNYLKQNKLIVESQHTNHSRLYWIDYGSSLSLEIPKEIYKKNDTRLLFMGWSGDLGSNESKVDINMSSPKTLIANWKTQFLVSFTTSGIPDKSIVELKINEQFVDIQTPATHESWMDSEVEIDLDVIIKSIQDGALRYEVIEWREEKLGKLSNPIIIDRPMKITAVLQGIKGKSNILCDIDQTNLFKNDNIKIFGSILPPRSNVPVNLYYSSKNGSWHNIAEISTDLNGTYTYLWKPNESGIINIRSGWSGDSKYEGAISNATMIYVGRNSQFFINTFKSLSSKTIEATEDKSPKIITNYLNSSTISIIKLMDSIYSNIGVIPMIGSLLAIFVGSLLIGILLIVPILLIILIIIAYLKGTQKWESGLKIILIFWLLSLSLITFIEVAFIKPLALPLLIFFTLISSALIAFLLTFALDRFCIRRIRSNL
jgi:hypothetical protein